MRTVLMVAEKPSLAAALANILSDGKHNSRKGSNAACQVHEWKGIFSNENVIFRMTSVCGHVLSIDFIQKYNNWDRVDPLELFSCPVERKEATPKLHMTSFLSQEARGCDYLILWLDCDKEGENICFEVIDAVKNSLRRPIYNDDVVWRAKFSSITSKDVKHAMQFLVKPNKCQALSVDARQELDLRIGCAFTRYQTKYFQGKYGNLDSSLISYGPCQTPTLGFCVERHDQIQSFKPEPYWVLQVSVMTDDNRELILSHSNSRIFDKEAARLLLNKVRALTSVKVINITTKEKWKSRPIALNTVQLMKHASSGLGMGPHHAMTLAEKLYTQGYISYPRTETTSYAQNFDLKEVLLMLKDNADYNAQIARILKLGINHPTRGVDVGDHPPITPTRLARCEELGESWRLYDYIARHFIATISKDCNYSTTVTTFTGNGETFTYAGDIVIDPGYTSVMPWEAINKSKSPPNVTVGDELPVRNVCLVDLKTTAPDYLTESELITLMEKHGIGTDASIPVHINNIAQRNYVTIGSGRRLIPTNLGIILVHGYQKIDRELVEPNVRSNLETELDLIARGCASYETVLADSIRLFKDKFVYFTKNIDSIDSLFEVSFTPLSETGRAFTRCGNCRRYMKFIQAKPSRLHCKNCNETYSLPQGGNIRKYKELKCPIDEFELLSWSAGSKGKSFALCPHCYNNPPFPDMKKATGCNNCLHSTCSESLMSVGIVGCSECSDGVYCLDPSSGPKWKICCNRCTTIMDVFEDAQKVIVCKEMCECGAKFVKVEYREEKTKLPGDRAEMTDCIFCCPGFEPLISQHAVVNSSYNGRGGHFRGGRGGRGGRGRGRGGGRRKNKPKPPKDKMAQLAAYFV